MRVAAGGEHGADRMTGAYPRARPGHITDLMHMRLALRRPRGGVADRSGVAGEHHRLAHRLRRSTGLREIEIRQHAVAARRRMDTEHGEAVGALDELHRRAP